MPNISLTPPLEDYVNRQIDAGRFANLSEATRAGLWLMMKNDAEFQRFKEFKAEMANLAERAMAGEGEPFDMKEFEPRLRTGFAEE